MHRSRRTDRLVLVVLGDQTCNVSSIIKRLFLGVPQSAAQTEFIRDASAALMAQVDRLRPFQREHLPEFKNLYDMARIYESTQACHPSITSVMLCTTQLLQLFRHFEAHGRRLDPDKDISAVGLCTGALVAAAYASSHSVDDLKLLAIPAVCMAFQLGLQAATASSMLYEQDSKLESWSVAIPNMTEDEALSALSLYDAGHSLSLRHRCFVSAVGLKSVTVSGTPPALKTFTDGLVESRPGQKIIPLPVFAGFHGIHIHPFLDFSSFLARCGVDSAILHAFKPVHDFLSPATGEPVRAADAYELFKVAVCETLQAPLRLDLIVDRYAAYIRDREASTVTVDIVSPTSVADSLVAAFQTHTQARVSSGYLVGLPPGHDLRTKPAYNNSPLAIVGMSGRFPGDTTTAEALWQLLAEKKDLHREVPEDRFAVGTHVDPSGKAKNTSWTPYGCFIDRPGDFDPRFFNMSPKEALQTDPMQRLALVTAYEALENAGFVPDRTRSSASHRVGTFYGQTSDDYRDVNAAQDIGTYFITGGIRAFGPGRINYFFKFSGPSYSVDTACSSSMAAIQLACTAIWNGECDTAVAGGLSVLTSPDLFSGLSRGQFLSRTGSCKTFDNSADGYCRADGIGTVVLKRLHDAELDRDNVLAVVLGAGTNHSAHAISITHPHAPTQSTLYREVLDQAGVDPHDVSYVEMHGTGTQAGDGTEMKSVTDVFASAHSPRARDNPLYVGAIKANVGHGEASSGVVSLIKAMLILRKSQIPPHVGIKDKLNVGFPDLAARNFHIAGQMTPFPEKKGVKKTMLINNFSAAGGNTALLIQEPPRTVVEDTVEPRHVHPVTVSGHSKTAFVNNIDRLTAFLESNPDTSLLDLSYTTTARRRHHAFRVTVVERSVAGVFAALKRKRASSGDGDGPKKAQSVVFTFTGQGASYPAMAREFYITSTQFRADVAHFDGIARQQGFPTFLGMIDGTITDLNQLSPVQTQVGLVCIQIALARLWSSFGIKPSAVIGHSLGEYAALQVAGALSVSDAILLVGARARLLESECEMFSHSMLAVAASEATVESLANHLLADIDLACSNTPQECVYAGPRAKMEALEQELKAGCIRSTQLRVPYAFHSAQVEPILNSFGSTAAIVSIGRPHTTVISATLGRVLATDEKVDAEYLKKHCRQTVQFARAMQDARQSGLIDETTTLIEIGPHPICSGMVRSTLGDQTHTLPTLRRKENPWTAIVGSLASLHDAGFKINWSEYQRDFESACRLIHLPSYAFDNKNYWIDYRHDWTLRKGEPVLAHAEPKLLTPAHGSGLISSSVNCVTHESYEGPEHKVIFETDLSHPDMHLATSGHRVNGSALCPSSMYADIALTVAQYLAKQSRSGFSLNGHDICDMEVTQPLIINPDREQEKRTLHVTARLNPVAQTVSLEYASLTSQHESMVKHAICLIKFGDPKKWSTRWNHDLHLVQDRIAGLKASSLVGKTSQITNRLAYRLFANLVDYSTDFQRMTQVWLDSETLEASAKVALDRRDSDANFSFSPYHLDGLLHLSGFIMNGNDFIDPHEAVYISHGWESLRLAKQLSPGADHEVYVRMIPQDKTMVAGNVYILEDKEIVGLCEGIRFQRVPRTVLDILLPPSSGRTSSAKAPGPVERRMIAKPKETKRSPPFSRAKSPTLTSTRKTVAAPSQQKPVPSPTATFITVIASEIGASPQDIKPTDDLGDLGVDSLMSLALAARLVEQCKVEVNHAEVMACHRVQDLLHLLEQRSGIDEETGSSDTCSESWSEEVDTGTTTPIISTGSGAPISADGINGLLLSILLEETGLDAEDLSPSADLADLGVDSLMSLTIQARLREAGIESAPSLCLEHKTVRDVLGALRKATDPDSATLEHTVTIDTDSAQEHHPESIERTSKCITLQRRSTTTVEGSLFLFPDGSGSPFAYAALDQLDPALDVYGLVSPFSDCPLEYTCGLEEAAKMYIRTILAKTTSGRLHLGGWSVGGVLAFEAVRQLAQIHNRPIASLVLVDAPCPLVLPPMDGKLIKHLDTLQLFGKDGQARTKRHKLVLQHFDATVANLGRYTPQPLSSPVKTLVLWAQDGVGKTGHASRDAGLSDDPIARWILDRRKEQGADGWDQVIPGHDVQVVRVPGNHFSMMDPLNIKMVWSALRAHFGQQ